MDRTQWQKERRLWNEVRMDTIDARQYDEKWGSHITLPTQRWWTLPEPLSTARAYS